MAATRIVPLLTSIICALALGGRARADGPDAAPGQRPLLDYTGKGTIQVTIPEASVVVGFEQSYVAPDAVLMAFEMDQLRQWCLVTGDRERTYNGGSEYGVEKQYRNLQKLPVHPSLAAQLSMAQFGRVIRDIRHVQVLGTEMMLGQECQIVRFSNRELADDLGAKGLIGEAGSKFIEKGMTRAWVTREHGLPVRIDIYGNDGTPAVVFRFSELAINRGLKVSELRIPVPKSVVWINVTSDVGVANWEEIEDREIRKQMLLLQKALGRKPNG
jgi:hypothetical protein